MDMTPVQAVPDNRGANLFAADPRFCDLLAVYLEPKLHAHLLPYRRCSTTRRSRG